MAEGGEIIKPGSGGLEAPSGGSEQPTQQPSEAVSGAARETHERFAGLELPANSPSEAPSNNAPMQAAGSSQMTGSQGAQSTLSDFDKNMPGQEVMIRKIKSELNAEINRLLKEKKRLAKSAASGDAYELNNVVARIRTLRAILAHLAHATVEYAKKLYTQLFKPKTSES